MKGRDEKREQSPPPSLMKTEMQKQGSAHKCEGPPRADKRWKIQTHKSLDRRVGTELGEVLGVFPLSPALPS